MTLKQLLQQQYKELDNELLMLYKKFIEQYVEQRIDPNTQKILYHDKPNHGLFDAERMLLDVKAYALLTHAQLQHFVQFVAEITFDKSKEYWETKKKLNDFLLEILKVVGLEHKQLVNDAFLSLLQKIQKQADSQFEEKLDRLVQEIEKSYKTLINQNMGINRDNLEKMLLIKFVPNDAKQLGMLNEFVRTRGKYAHKKITDEISPSKMQNLVINAQELFGEMMRMIISQVKT